MFTTDGILSIIKGRVKAEVSYDDIKVNADSTAIILHQVYTNESINMKELIKLLLKLGTKPFAEIKDKKTPFDLLAGIIIKK